MYVLQGMSDDLTPKTEGEMRAFKQGCADMKEIQKKGDREFLIAVVGVFVPIIMFIVLCIILFLV
jgi:hypothetical protein